MPTQAALWLVLALGLGGALAAPAFDGWVGALAEEVVARYFGRFRCATYVADDGVDVAVRGEVPALVIRLPASKELLKESFEQGCGGFVVRASNKSEVARKLIEAKHAATKFRYNNQRYLFLPIDEEDGNVELLSEPEMFFLPNLALAVPENGRLVLATHTVFDHHKHDLLNVTHEALDAWVPGTGFRLGTDLFPDSLVQKRGNATVFDGFETRIAAEFVELVNGTWEGLDHPVEMWGNAFPNGTGTGVVGSVMGHRADFGFAAFYQWFCEECDCTYPFYQSAVTCLVPRPEPLSGWLTIILPFTPGTWVALVVTYFLTSTFLFVLHLAMQQAVGADVRDKIGKALSDSFFTNFRLQLEQVPDIRKSKPPLSVYVKVSVYYYFFVAASWQGGISSILTVPRFESPVNTVSDLIARWPKLQWGANSDAWVNSIKASSDPSLEQIVNKFTTLDDDILRERTKTRDFAFFIEELPHGHFGYNDYISEESMKYLRLMETNIYSAFGVLIQPKGSPYSEKFDETILRLFDTGIVHKIEVQVSLDRINNRLQNMIRFSNLKDKTTVTLAVKHIQGPLFIFVAGMLLALVVFFLEAFAFKRRNFQGRSSDDGFSHGQVPSFRKTTPSLFSTPSTESHHALTN